MFLSFRLVSFLQLLQPALPPSLTYTVPFIATAHVGRRAALQKRRGQVPRCHGCCSNDDPVAIYEVPSGLSGCVAKHRARDAGLSYRKRRFGPTQGGTKEPIVGYRPCYLLSVAYCGWLNRCWSHASMMNPTSFEETCSSAAHLPNMFRFGSFAASRTE